MSERFSRGACAFVSGALFGVGLAVSGMTRPEKVLGFLDIFGSWDASLLFVMVGAVAVYALAHRSTRSGFRPWFARELSTPLRAGLDARLVLGAAVFGVGWGLAGYCPGPAIVAAPSGGSTVVFVLAMMAGFFMAAKLLPAPSE